MKDIRERNEDTAGYRISELRKDRGWNQKELAEKTGIRQSNISRIENGSASPTIDTLARIAAGLGKQLKIDFV